MIRSAILTLALYCVAAVMLTGCGPKPSPRPTLIRLYESRQESLEGVDLTVLRGRTIVVDPGHGGVFRGARGIGGLDEADVNLGVGLYLWGLLEEAGAHAVLTRKTDRDFVDGDSLRLRDDLQARLDIVAEHGADIFISLHHNADFAGDRSRNEIQVYYKMTDPGPSLDMARIVARHLRMNIGEAKTSVIPGNYYVLRNCTVPAILCEPSYLSNPAIEDRLKLSNKQRLEAEVYFLALLDYFARGLPHVRSYTDCSLCDAEQGIRITYEPSATIDPATVEIKLDGVDLDPVMIGPNDFAAFPEEPLENRRHRTEISARSMGGNASNVITHDFMVSLPPHTISVSVDPPVPTPPHPARIAAIVLDKNGNPVADSTGILFSWEGGEIESVTVLGCAAVYVGRDIPFGTQEITAECGDLRRSVSLEDKDVAQYVSGFVTSTRGEPVWGANVILEPVGDMVRTDAQGYFHFALGNDTPAPAISASKPGFRAAGADLSGGDYPVVELGPFYESLSEKHVVALDAQGGGEDMGWIGPSGVTAADLNLEVARRAAVMLASVGVDTRLTRSADRRTTPTERVKMCETWNSLLVVSIGHGELAEATAGVYHYPGSRGGTALAEHLSSEIGLLTEYWPTIGETAEYLIQQTSCPAVSVVFMTPGSIENESALLEAFGIWQRAYAIHCGVVRYLGVDEADMFSIAGRVSRGDLPCRDAVVTVDGALATVTDSTGRFTFRLLEQGTHTLDAYSGEYSSGPVLIDESMQSVEITLE
jgi:N-acetylmuramoyl-L-alanine amidase